MTSPALDRLKEIVGPKGFITDPLEIEPYLVEERGLFRGETPVVLRPSSTEEVAEIVKTCIAARLPIVPQGGNTGLCAGGVPWQGEGSVLVSLTRMNRVRAIDALNYTLTVEAGCILTDVQKAADEADRLFPLSLGSEGSCRIGGNLSTNAGGIQVLRYGNARDLVLGLEVVLPDGQVWDGLRGLRKDNTGYDLKQLFIGAEGTLGIITAATLKLFPRPTQIETAFAGVARVEDAMELFAQARKASGDQLTAFELIPRIGLEFAMKHGNGVVDPLASPYPWYALIEVSSSQPGGGLRETLESFLAKAIEEKLAADATISANSNQSRALWLIRETVVEAQKHEGGSIKHDIAVPVSRVAEFITRAVKAVSDRLPGIRPVPFGHAGDGNIHFNLTQPVGYDKAAYIARWQEFNDIVHAIVADLGGSISAEHGVGRLKRDELLHFKSTLELQLMKKIKKALDPLDIMNPGKVISPSIPD